MPTRTSDGFVDLSRQRLGLGLPRLRNLYRKGLVQRFARMIGLPNTANGPLQPLAHYTKPLMLAQLERFLKTGIKRDAASPTGVAAQTLVKYGESTAIKDGKKQRGEQHWMSYMLGAMNDSQIGLHRNEEGTVTHLTYGMPTEDPVTRMVTNGIGSLKALGKRMDLTREDALHGRHVDLHPKSKELVNGTKGNFVSIAKLLGPKTTREQWKWARAAYSRFIHHATFKVAATECAPCMEIEGIHREPTADHYVGVYIATKPLQTVRHHAVCGVLSRLCTSKGFRVEKEKEFPHVGENGKRADVLVQTRRGTAVLEITVVSHMTEAKFDNKLEQIDPILKDLKTHEYAYDCESDDERADRLWQWAGGEVPRLILKASADKIERFAILKPANYLVVYWARIDNEATSVTKVARKVQNVLLEQVKELQGVESWTRLTCVHNVPGWTSVSHEVFNERGLKQAVAVQLDQATCVTNLKTPGVSYNPAKLRLRWPIEVTLLKDRMGVPKDYPTSDSKKTDLGDRSKWANTFTVGIPVVFDIAGTLMQRSTQLLKEHLHITPSAAMAGGLPILEWNYRMALRRNRPQWWATQLR
ncbi:Hypp3451 [Branchiostoma lanceolatum]|uniref:Hypp3451 protein n=1 Tax=Branchiostoma lanceolatum TaxID=7740 RepID=A0A8K0A222_BRALA|nr:Hypp3451 [Branchiostoma lanceolatum]